MSDKSVIIIGAGIAGLCGGCYLQMNGYRTAIFEMHDKPGGLCTAWQRKGYTIDGCLHWLVGSGPGTGLYRLWQEVGAIQGREMLNMERFAIYEGSDGNKLELFTDLNRLEEHMLRLAPDDSRLIKEFIGGARAFVDFDMPIDKAPELYTAWDGLKMTGDLLPKMRQMMKWKGKTTNDFIVRMKSPLVREGLASLWPPESGILFLLMTLAWMHKKTAGYPLGGSLPFSRAIEKRYLGLGGQVNYKSRVEKVLVENNRAIGVRLVDGSEHHADLAISAADGHSTIFDMLEGKYLSDKIRGYYETLPTFTPLLFVGLGVNRKFDDTPQVISGISFPLAQSVTIAGTELKRLSVRVHNFDPSLAPPGKTALTIMLPADWDYWKRLRDDMPRYREEKEKAADAVVSALEQCFPGITAQVEMRDIATPVTFNRYTGNWKGIFEGWLPPVNSFFMRMDKTLPGLDNFYMIGQWVEPGGGVPSGVLSGRNVTQIICKRDGKKFTTSVPG